MCDQTYFYTWGLTTRAFSDWGRNKLHLYSEDLTTRRFSRDLQAPILIYSIAGAAWLTCIRPIAQCGNNKKCGDQASHPFTQTRRKNACVTKSCMQLHRNSTDTMENMPKLDYGRFLLASFVSVQCAWCKSTDSARRPFHGVRCCDQRTGSRPALLRVLAREGSHCRLCTGHVPSSRVCFSQLLSGKSVFFTVSVWDRWSF